MKIDVFIEKVSSFLPNNPIGNEEMEEYLGLIEGKPSRVKNLVLKQNGIQRRYYALNKNQEITHTNAELAAMAIRRIFKEEGDLANVELMTTATSIPDQILPSHASMVHGLLPELGNIEIFSTAGVCLTSLQALKIAYLAVAVGDKENAICSASELVSAQMSKINARLLELKDNPKATLGFNLPNERIVMQEGKVLSRTRVSDFERAINRAGSTFITSMTANQSTKFNTRSDEINVTSTAYVQSMFLWSFELRDDAFGHYWNESGVASSNLSHDWIYSLSKPGTDNFWRFSSTGTQTDGTNITFSFYK